MSELIHPRKLAALAAFYPYRATFYASPLLPANDDEEAGDYAPVDGLQDLPAALEVAVGGAGGNFERDAAGGEKLLFSEYVAAIAKGQRVEVSLNAWSKMYSVSDAEPVAMGTQTLVSLEPIF